MKEFNKDKLFDINNAIQIFTSKKNTVFLTELYNQKVVVKVFSDYERFVNELKMLEILSVCGITPTMVFNENKYGAMDNKIVYEYIEGRTLLEYMEDVNLSFQESELVFQNLIYAIRKMLSVGVDIMDYNYRNIVFDKKHNAFLIDLEDARLLMPHEINDNSCNEYMRKIADFGQKYTLPPNAQGLKLLKEFIDENCI